MAGEYNHAENFRNFLFSKPCNEQKLVEFVNRIILSVCRKFSKKAEDYHGTFWAKLMEERKKLSYKNLSEEKIIRSYLNKMFRNIIIDDIYQDNTGYRAREKQVGRIMRKIAVLNEGRSHWQLKHVRPVKTAGPDDLQKAGETIAPPVLSFTRDDRTAEIPDKKMEIFLTELIEKSGGCVEKGALTSYIYSLYQYEQSMPPKTSDQEQHEIYASFECAEQAEEIFSQMTDRVRLYHYYKMEKNYKTKTIADRMKVSVGTVDNIKKEHLKLFQDSTRYSESEMKDIIILITAKVKAEKGQHEEEAN